MIGPNIFIILIKMIGSAFALKMSENLTSSAWTPSEPLSGPRGPYTLSLKHNASSNSDTGGPEFQPSPGPWRR